MDPVELLGSSLGLGFLAGLRLYLTVFLVGWAMHFHWLHADQQFPQLAILGDWRVLTAAGSAATLEFFADKVPWIDSIWDAIHTFIRPVGAAFLALGAAGHVAPEWRLIVFLLGGAVALTGHSTKAATRVLANHSPEPVSNILLSLGEDLAVPAGLWVVAHHPLVMLGFVACFVLLFLWLAPKLWRYFRRQWERLSRWRTPVEERPGSA